MHDLENNFFDGGCLEGELCGYAHTEKELLPKPELPPQQYQFSLYLEQDNGPPKVVTAPNSFSSKGAAKAYVAAELIKQLELGVKNSSSKIGSLQFGESMSKTQRKKCFAAVLRLANGANSNFDGEPEQWFARLSSQFGQFYPSLMGQIKHFYPSFRHFVARHKKDFFCKHLNMKLNFPAGLILDPDINLKNTIKKLNPEAAVNILDIITNNKTDLNFASCSTPHPDIVSRVGAAGPLGVAARELKLQLTTELGLTRTVKIPRLLAYLQHFSNVFCVVEDEQMTLMVFLVSLPNSECKSRKRQ